MALVYPSMLGVAKYSNLHMLADKDPRETPAGEVEFELVLCAIVLTRRAVYILLISITFVILMRLIKKNHKLQYGKHRFSIMLYFSMVLVFSVVSLIVADAFGLL